MTQWIRCCIPSGRSGGWLWQTLLAAGLFWMVSTVSAAVSPVEIIHNATDEMIAQVEANREAIEADPTRIHALVDQYLLPYADFQRISRWILGRYWRRASPDQRERFAQEFRTMLIRTYAIGLLQYTDVDITYLPLKQTVATQATVPTLVSHRAGKPVPIDYQLMLENGHWRIVDVSIEGVSMVSTFRTTVATEIKRYGLAGFLEKLHERNEKLAETPRESASIH